MPAVNSVDSGTIKDIITRNQKFFGRNPEILNAIGDRPKKGHA